MRQGTHGERLGILCQSISLESQKDAHNKINVSGIETLQGKSRSSRMTGHNAANLGCTDFIGKDVLIQEEALTEEICFLENARALFSLSLFIFLLNQSGAKIKETDIALMLLNARELCQEMYIAFSFQIQISKRIYQATLWAVRTTQTTYIAFFSLNPRICLYLF